MNIQTAATKVLKLNPSAFWVPVEWFKGEPDVFEIYGLTYSDEVASKIAEYDCCTEELTLF